MAASGLLSSTLLVEYNLLYPQPGIFNLPKIAELHQEQLKGDLLGSSQDSGLLHLVAALSRGKVGPVALLSG